MTKITSINSSNFWEILKKIGIVVAIIMPTIIAINAYTQLRKENTELTLTLLSSKDMLPSVDKDEDILAIYKFRDSIVSELVLVTYEIVNTGDVTIVGSGGRSNLVEPEIKFVPNKPEYIYNDILIDKNVPNAIIRFDTLNNLILEFTQWKPLERLVFSLYYAKNYYEELDGYILKPKDRFLIDGDIKNQMYVDKVEDSEYKIYNGLNPVIRLIVIVSAVVFLTTVLILVIYFYFLTIKNTINLYLWNNKYHDQVKNFLKTTPRENWYISSYKTESINEILKNIDNPSYARLRNYLNVPRRESGVYYNSVWRLMYSSIFVFIGVAVLVIMIISHFENF